jgi:hypothetical protein
VHAETEGNPFFVGEVLRHLAETGALVLRDGRWTSDLSIDQDTGKVAQAVDLPHDLVAIAYGLSFHTGEYPEFVLPRDVDPFSPSLPYREIKDYEDQ